ncbi:hypothetical protein MBSD_n1558 [Mizugakiibacter sediminis]|uniref:Peptidase S74 domain-containing protein n=1 Tax=Mizugakiibacter sediminis TaxID=1475481 RepID=A0A0K8QN04_9GAMM|nr:tail fiber domain-containing protein [Mizugakiibacter sediminis]GAP66254.1 hypothetical protein MBSD_n1558 [Mizugakiibacter sediminis]
MRRIDTPDGLYHDFDPQSGEAGTIVKAAPMNAIQEEIIAVITGAGLTLDPNANNQLWQAIQAITGGGVAWGAITGKPETATRWPTWLEVTGKPATFTPTAHTHDWADLINVPVYATRWPAWTDVTSKPATFPPDAHTHAIANVNGLQAALDAKAPLNAPVFTTRASVNTANNQWGLCVNLADGSAARGGIWCESDGISLVNANTWGTPFKLFNDGTVKIGGTGWSQITLGNGSVAVTGALTATGGFQVGSSEHLKTDLEPLPYGLDEIDAIAVRRGRYIPEFTADGRRRLFVIAEQLATVVPEAVFEDGIEHDGKRYASVEYSQLVPVLISAVQELSARLRAIEKASLIA